MTVVQQVGSSAGVAATAYRRIGLVAVGGIVSLLWGLAGGVSAQSPAGQRHNALAATASKAARDSAIRSIPMDKLDAKAQAKVRNVLGITSVFRRLPISVIQCDPEMYLFLVHRPDVVVNTWRVLGLSQMSMERIGADTFRLDDGAGTRGTLEFLYRSNDTQLVYVSGTYRGPPFPKPVEGHGVLLLRCGYAQEPNNRYYITNRMDAFMAVEPGAAEIMTRTLQPLIGKIADANFAQTVGFVSSLSRTAELNEAGMHRLAGKLTLIEPAARQELVEIASRVAQRAAGAPASPAPQTPLVAQRSTIVDTQPAAGAAPQGSPAPAKATR
jgi:hypothetical protein